MVLWSRKHPQIIEKKDEEDYSMMAVGINVAVVKSSLTLLHVRYRS
jgi:hypothetical protein